MPPHNPPPARSGWVHHPDRAVCCATTDVSPRRGHGAEGWPPVGHLAPPRWTSGNQAGSQAAESVEALPLRGLESFAGRELDQASQAREPIHPVELLPRSRAAAVLRRARPRRGGTAGDRGRRRGGPRHLRGRRRAGGARHRPRHRCRRRAPVLARSPRLDRARGRRAPRSSRRSRAGRGGAAGAGLDPRARRHLRSARPDPWPPPVRRSGPRLRSRRRSDRHHVGRHVVRARGALGRGVGGPRGRGDGGAVADPHLGAGRGRPHRGRLPTPDRRHGPRAFGRCSRSANGTMAPATTRPSTCATASGSSSPRRPKRSSLRWR